MIRWIRKDGWTRGLVAECIDGTVQHVIPFYVGQDWVNQFIKDKMVGDVLPNNLKYGDCSFFYVMDESIVKKTSINVVLRACIPFQHPLLSTNRNEVEVV